MSGSTSLPLLMPATGPQTTPVETIQQALITQAAANNPDYTASLPGSLIEDVSSTQVAGIAMLDQARVDAINSVSPLGANAFVLAALGQQFGIAQGSPTNTSVYVQFTGTGSTGPGYIIPAGFTVSDGTYQYVVQEGGILQSNSVSPLLFAIATVPGSWAPAANTVTTIVSSIASGTNLTVSNPEAGTPGNPDGETTASYRARVYQAFAAPAVGTPAYLLTQLRSIPGVTSQTSDVRQVPGGWEVLCGGGDPYAVANAIYSSILDLSHLQGSLTPTRNVLVTVVDPPDSYNVVFVNPPQQVVTITATWTTDLSGFTNQTQVNQLGAAALTNYINSIPVGKPINEIDMTVLFQDAVSQFLPTANIASLAYNVVIDGTAEAPAAGVSLIYGDPESYFSCASGAVTVTQG